VLIFGPWSNYEYSFEGQAVGWQNQLGGWTIGQAPFGSDNSGVPSDFLANTYWPSDGNDGIDLYLRKEFILDASFDLNSIYYDFGVDNGLTMWVNGNQVIQVYEEGYTSRWEYSGLIPSSFLNYGSNIIAIGCDDTGGATAFDMQLRGSVNDIIVAWSTGATTPSITVSPTQTTTYSATVTTATQTCTDEITIIVNPLLTWYADADGDGFGNANGTTQACDQPAGFVADNSDCNDNSNTTYPGAEEICFDQIDNNCNGTVDENCAVYGCINPNACNFNPAANTDDGSCILPQP
jgi:hypothetical protein